MIVKVKTLVPELTVDDVQRSIDFYCGILGFSLVGRAPEHGVPTWAEVALDGVHIMMQAKCEMFSEMPILKRDTLGGTSVLVLRLVDTKMVHQVVQALRGHEVVMPLRETDYGTVEVAYADPDGYVLLLAAEKAG